MALIPLAVRAVDRATVTRVAVVAADPVLGQRAVGVMDGFLNVQLDSSGEGQRNFLFEQMDDRDEAVDAVSEGLVAGAVLIERTGDGGLDFRVVTVGGLGQDRAQLLGHPEKLPETDNAQPDHRHGEREPADHDDEDREDHNGCCCTLLLNGDNCNRSGKEGGCDAGNGRAKVNQGNGLVDRNLGCVHEGQVGSGDNRIDRRKSRRNL